MLALPGPLFDIRQGVDIKGAHMIIDLNEAISGTGGSFWDSSIILAKFLEENNSLIENKITLELGAGIGITSIACKILGASRVIATDLGEVLIGARRNIERNSVTIDCVELDWFSPFRIDADIIISADVVWIRELIKPYVQTLRLQLTDTNYAILCNKIRSIPIHREFKAELKEAGIEIRKLKKEIDFRIWRLSLSSQIINSDNID
ncbi:unnamed protein product [Blepharisma stoltei]|uniref:Methyltransferase n=1 Tax=Blepharisma stoltei TaxID=1481888 RepID=A0AAU9JMF3_9CILI|nr:unnamed protein product [Blepharisma stoltei]